MIFERDDDFDPVPDAGPLSGLAVDADDRLHVLHHGDDPLAIIDNDGTRMDLLGAGWAGLVGHKTE